MAVKNVTEKGGKLSQKEIVERFISIHGDVYDYSKVVYKNNETKVEIMCKIHGFFWQRPYSHEKHRLSSLCWFGTINDTNIHRESK